MLPNGPPITRHALAPETRKKWVSTINVILVTVVMQIPTGIQFTTKAGINIDETWIRCPKQNLILFKDFNDLDL